MALCKGNQYSKHRYASATLACLHICASGGLTCRDIFLEAALIYPLFDIKMYFLKKYFHGMAIIGSGTHKNPLVIYSTVEPGN